jgi:hypothetical protein
MPAEKRARMFVQINHQPQVWPSAFRLADGQPGRPLANEKERVRV